jgi:hypothetical protein
MVPATCGRTDERWKPVRAPAVTRFVGGLLMAGVALGLSMVAQADDAKDMQKNERQVQANTKRLDDDAARAARTPDGQRRLDERLGKQFNVNPSVVSGLRDRHFSYGQATIALALSQQLMKQDKTLSQQAALDKIVADRQAGKGWGVIARDLKLKLGDVVSDVKKADKTAEHVAAGKSDKVDQNVAKVDKPDKPEKPAKPEKPGR